MSSDEIFHALLAAMRAANRSGTSVTDAIDSVLSGVSFDGVSEL